MLLSTARGWNVLGEYKARVVLSGNLIGNTKYWKMRVLDKFKSLSSIFQNIIYSPDHVTKVFIDTVSSDHSVVIDLADIDSFQTHLIIDNKVVNWC